ncbi:unnamed protein product [Candida verbasci]|uniref:Transcription activator GCR1-like domain-containing protein n=1 Tax=Candida verbasci TaxID=1227364 RepID=A0A9W4TUL8_9ASCO|nr:unnamed protein product [Candida verbasci]
MGSESKRIKNLETKFNDKFYTLQQEVSLLRQIVDFQNTKIDKLSKLYTDLIEDNKLAKQQHDEDVLNALNDVEVESLPETNELNNEPPSPSHLNNLQIQQHQQRLHQQHLHNQIGFESNMDPALQEPQPQQHPKPIEQPRPKRKKIEKKMNILFLHNPTTIREIYDEFYKGYKGQEPLCELDAKYGKHVWRGDSRSKESKRFQRRKKLCDAIQRGMIKYGKSADEIIDFIEKFRGDKSLTWIMNGNLPPDIDG